MVPVEGQSLLKDGIRPSEDRLVSVDSAERILRTKFKREDAATMVKCLGWVYVKWQDLQYEAGMGPSGRGEASFDTDKSRSHYSHLGHTSSGRRARTLCVCQRLRGISMGSHGACPNVEAIGSTKTRQPPAKRLCTDGEPAPLRQRRRKYKLDIRFNHTHPLVLSSN
jgi:hypothetical protein